MIVWSFYLIVGLIWLIDLLTYNYRVNWMESYCMLLKLTHSNKESLENKDKDNCGEFIENIYFDKLIWKSWMDR